MAEENKEKKINNEPWWRPAIFMFLRLSGWIAIPIIIAVFFGKWLDKKYDTEPWLFLGSVGAAFLISIIGLIKNTLKEFKNIEKENPPTEGEINKNNNLKKNK